MSIQPHSNQLTLFAEASPVSPSVLQDDEKAPQTTDGSGPNTSVSFAALSPDGYWWRTYQGSYQYLMDGSLQEYSATWPKAGTMRTGTVYRQQPSAPHIYGTGSLLWPTPTVGGSETSYQQEHVVGTRHALNLHRAVKLWPTTPTAGTGTKGRSQKWRKGKTPNPQEYVHLYPTPTVQDATNNGGPSQSLRNTPPLNAAIGGKLNPTWVAWLMGFPLEWLNLKDSGMP